MHHTFIARYGVVDVPLGICRVIGVVVYALVLLPRDETLHVHRHVVHPFIAASHEVLQSEDDVAKTARRRTFPCHVTVGVGVVRAGDEVYAATVAALCLDVSVTYECHHEVSHVLRHFVINGLEPGSAHLAQVHEVLAGVVHRGGRHTAVAHTPGCGVVFPVAVGRARSVASLRALSADASRTHEGVHAQGIHTDEAVCGMHPVGFYSLYRLTVYGNAFEVVKAHGRGEHNLLRTARHVAEHVVADNEVKQGMAHAHVERPDHRLVLVHEHGSNQG